MAGLRKANGSLIRCRTVTGKQRLSYAGCAMMVSPPRLCWMARWTRLIPLTQVALPVVSERAALGRNRGDEQPMARERSLSEFQNAFPDEASFAACPFNRRC